MGTFKDPFARFVQSRPAQAILKEKYGGAYFLRQTPFENRYYALAEIAYLAGRKKAAKTMAIYAAIEGFIMEARPPLGFLQEYDMERGDSRLARAMAISVCIKIGANDVVAKIQSGVVMTNEEIEKFVMGWDRSARYIRRRANGETFAPLPEDNTLKEFYLEWMRGRGGIPDETLPNERAAAKNVAMAMFGTDGAIA